MTDKLIQIKDADGNNLYPCVDYNNAANRPSINNVTLVGNKSLSDLGIQTGKTLLWTNTSPTSDFNGQTIQLNASANNYDFLIFIALNTKDLSGMYYSNVIPIISGITNFTIVAYQTSTEASTSNTWIAWRNVSVSGTSVTIDNAMFNAAGTGGYNRADLCIPVYIYGIKL